LFYIDLFIKELLRKNDRKTSGARCDKPFRETSTELSTVKILLGTSYPQAISAQSFKQHSKHPVLG
jgi:hypothetical protein